MNYSMNVARPVLIFSLFFLIIFSSLAPGCKKKEEGPNIINQTHRLHESITYNNDGGKMKGLYEYEGDLLLRATLHDSLAYEQWAAVMKDEVQYPDGNTVEIISYNYSGEWKEYSKLEVKLKQDKVVEISEYSKKENDWQVNLNKTFSYSGDLLQKEIRTIWMGGDFSITEKYEFEYSGDRMDRASLYLLNEDWILYYKWEYGYMGTFLDNIIISGYNSTDDSWYLFYKIGLDRDNGNIVKAHYYDYDDESGAWISDYFQEFEYDEYSNLVSRREIDSQYGEEYRQYYYYEEGKGNVKQLVFYAGHDETQFWMPFPTKSQHTELFRTGRL
jgi:hypothetical protein